MNYLKIQFNNGLIQDFKTPFNNPNLDNLNQLNSYLFTEYKDKSEHIKRYSNVDLFYKESEKINTISFMGANVLSFYKIDGRTKFAKNLKYYSHRFLFTNY